MREESPIKKLLQQAWSKRRIGAYDEARKLVKEAEKSCKDYDHESWGRIFHVKMQFESDHGDYSKAVEYSQKSLSYYKQANNLDRIAHSMRHLADLQYQLGLYVDAEKHYRESIGMYRTMNTTQPGDLANALRPFGLLLQKSGKIEEAITTWEETKKLYEFCNLQAGVDEANQKLDELR